MPETPPPAQKTPNALKLIAAVKMLKGVALAGVALGLFSIVHRDLDTLAEAVHRVHADLAREPLCQAAARKAGVVEPHSIVKAGIVTAFYAAILLGEGIGLWIGAPWAEYVVIVTTGMFVPEEILTMVREPNLTKGIMIVVNAVILVYVISVVWKKRFHARKEAVAA